MSCTFARPAHKIAVALTVTVILFLTLLTQVGALTPGDKAARGPDRFLVKFTPGTPGATITELNRAHSVTQLLSIKQIGVRVLTVPPGKTAKQMAERYAKNPNVEFAEPDYAVSAKVTPNDPVFWRQWAHPYVNTPQAWDTTTGASAVTIAVLDTGLDMSHPELAGRVLAGYDFINNDADPSDDHGHGTRVAGIAVATGNNALGVAGMDWNARVMPVKVLDFMGSGTLSVIARGLVYAADHGAKVINMSLGGPTSNTLQSAVRYAYDKGCTLVAASGNEASGTPIYPAGYPEVIAVGSVYRDTISSSSNYGPHLDVVAPGETIDTIALGGTYGRVTGTSAATPFVSGLAALIYSVAPQLSPQAVMNAITSSARDLGSSGWDPYYGWGHIDAARALAAAGAEPPLPAPGEPDPEPQPNPGPAPTVDLTPPTVRITNPADGALVSGVVTISAEAADESGIARLEFYANGVLLGTVQSAPYLLSWNTKKLSGTYALTARAYDTAGNLAESAPVRVTISTAIRTAKPPKGG